MSEEFGHRDCRIKMRQSFFVCTKKTDLNTVILLFFVCFVGKEGKSS